MEASSVVTYGCLHPNYNEAIRYFRECKVYGIQLESTASCTQGCLYCYATLEDAQIREVPSEDVLAVLDSAAKIDIKVIDWLGGDPLLRNDWYELTKYAMSKELTNSVWTSGIPLADLDVAKRTVEVTEGGFISVHLDSLDEEIYRRLHTGDPRRKIETILKGVDNVQSLGKKPENMINCITFTKPLAGEDIKKTIKYFFEEKGMRTCLTQMCTVGLAKDHPEWIPTLDEIREACEYRDESNFSKSGPSISPMDVNKFYCGGMICVTADGDVTPCSVIRRGFGNIRQTPLERIVEEHRNELLKIHLRDQRNLPGYCSSCEHNSVCWGCRATAFYEKGDLFAADPKCWRNPINYNKPM